METMIIPRISDEELMKRYSKIRPIVSIDGVKYFLRDYTLEKIKFTSYIWYVLEDKTEFADYDSSMKVIDFKCLHTYGHPLMFNPSIAEVLSQIPDGNLEKVDAFEIIEEPQCLGELQFDESAYEKGYHVSIVRLYKRT